MPKARLAAGSTLATDADHAHGRPVPFCPPHVSRASTGNPMHRRSVGGAVEDSLCCHRHDCGGSCAICWLSPCRRASDRHLQWQAACPAGCYLRLAGNLPRVRAASARALTCRPTRGTCWPSSLNGFDVLGAALDRLPPRRQACVRFATGTGGSVWELLSGVARARRINRAIWSGAVAPRRPAEGARHPEAVRRSDRVPLVGPLHMPDSADGTRPSL